jgi:hypothetical protein
LKPSEGLRLATSLLEGSKVQENVKNFQKASRQAPTGRLSPTWRRGFLWCNRQLLSTAKGHRLHNARLEDLTHDNIDAMYDLVYEQMIKAGVAATLPPEEHHWVDKDGNVCEKGSAAGHKVTIKLTHPQWCLFGDEVGTDTAQEEDGHVGGQTYLSFRGRRVQLTSSKSRSRFTTMGLTAGTGEPVMCIIIFAAAEMDVLTCLGFDHQAEASYVKEKTL